MINRAIFIGERSEPLSRVLNDQPRDIYMVVSVRTWKVAIVRTEYDYTVSFQSFQECPHQKLFFDLKDKNYKKVKMKGGLGWMKNIGNDPRSLFNGNHFSSVTWNHGHGRLYYKYP